MADYSNFPDFQIHFTPEFKKLYYLAMFCLMKNDNWPSDRPLNHHVVKELKDRVLEMAVFPVLSEIDHPMAKKYSDHRFEIKPDFTQEDFDKIMSDLIEWGTMGPDFEEEFEAYVEECQANNPYATD